MFDEIEGQDAGIREANLFKAFGERLQTCADACPGLAAHLQGHKLVGINSREALETLPVLRKAELMAAQQADPPFGGFVRQEALNGMRMFTSPGPVWEPQVSGADPWQGARALHAAGIRAGDVLHNAFSYHLTPGGFILDEAARALGCVVFPAGVGNTEAQVAALRHSGASVYTGTPDYLQTLLDHAKQEGDALTSITRALVSGGALFPAMRKRYQEQGIAVQQCYATADLGVIAYETASAGVVHPGMMINEGLIVEILVPGTGTPVTKGEVGEIVVTRLHPDYPLIRFGTGDLSRDFLEPSPCGRTNQRIAGWMGRADQRVKVRGMFIDPLQLAHLRQEYPQIQRLRVVITRADNNDVMTLYLAVVSDQSSVATATNAVLPENKVAWTQEISQSLRKACGLSGEVQIVDELPDDGIVVEDQRDYE